MGNVRHAATGSLGSCSAARDTERKSCKPMASKSNSLNAEIAETVFGWEAVHSHEGRLIGKKPDKLGRMRTAKVPDYAGEPTLGTAIDERMKELGKEALYLKTLARLTDKEKLPVHWATPEHRLKAALAVVRMKRKK